MRELKERPRETQYRSVFLRKKDLVSKKRTYDFGRTLFIIILLNIILAVVMLFLNNFSDNIAQTQKNNEEPFFKDLVSKIELPQKNVKVLPINFFKKEQNILLLGVDKNENSKNPFRGTRSDTIIVINIDPASHTINAISIPRDSKVYISGDYGVQKINSAHALGGVELTKKTIEETLGIKINNYIAINNEGVRKLIDSLGGVPVYIEKNMYYNDNSQDLHINLKKGLHVLNGEEAEGYIRYRHDGLGDIGRTSRQQWFLRSLLTKLQSSSSVTKIPEVIQLALTYIKTDLSLYELTQLASFVKSVDMDKIEVATLPGSPSKKGYISYWILDPEKTQEVIDRLIYRDYKASIDKKLVAGIVYTPKQEEEAMKTKTKLEEYGYEVNCMGRANLPHSQVIGHNSAVSGNFINWLKKKIPEIKSSQFVYDPIRTYCVKSDFTIIIADN